MGENDKETGDGKVTDKTKSGDTGHHKNPAERQLNLLEVTPLKPSTNNVTEVETNPWAKQEKSKADAPATKETAGQPEQQKPLEQKHHQEQPKFTDRPNDKVNDKLNEAFGINAQANYEVKELLLKIGNKRAEISNLFEKGQDGLPKLKSEKVSDSQGNKVDAETRLKQLTAEIKSDYDQAIASAQKAAAQPISGAEVKVFQESQTNLKRMIELEKTLSSHGVNVKSADGKQLDYDKLEQAISSGKLSPTAQSAATELHTKANKQQELNELSGHLKALKEGPAFVSAQAAEFFTVAGNPTLAKHYIDQARATQSPGTFSEYFKETAKVVDGFVDTNKLPSVIHKYDNSKNNPFQYLKTAGDLAAQGKHAEAQAEFSKAREASKAFQKDFPPETIKKDLKTLENELHSTAEQYKKLQENTALSAQEKQLKLTEIMARQQELASCQAYLYGIQSAKEQVELGYAAYLTKQHPQKNTEAIRVEAAKILTDIRYSDNGKIALALNSDLFNDVWLKSMGGKESNTQNFVGYVQQMQQAEALRQQAFEMAKAKYSNEDVQATMRAAEEAYKKALYSADKIDLVQVKDNQKILTGKLQSMIDAEMAKPADERDPGKLRVLNDILAVDNLRTPNKFSHGLLNEFLKKDSERDPKKMEELTKLIKNPDELQDLVSLYVMMRENRDQIHAANYARLGVLETAVMLNEGDRQAIVSDIELHDPSGMFRDGLGDTAEGKAVWESLKEAADDSYTAQLGRWFTHNKDTVIAVGAGVVGFAVGTAVAGLTFWSGPGAAVFGSSAGAAAAGFVVGIGAGTLAGGTTSYLAHGALGDGFKSEYFFDGAISGGGGATAGASKLLLAGLARTAYATGTGLAAGEGSALTLSQTAQAWRTANWTQRALLAGGNRYTSSLIAGYTGAGVNRFGFNAKDYYHGKYNNPYDYLADSSQSLLWEGAFSSLAAFILPGGLKPVDSPSAFRAFLGQTANLAKPGVLNDAFALRGSRNNYGMYYDSKRSDFQRNYRSPIVYFETDPEQQQ